MKTNLLILLFTWLTFADVLASHTILWDANWSADGQYIAVGGNDSILRIYDGHTLDLLSRDTLKGSIYRLRWHPSDNILAIVGDLDAIQLVNFENKTRVKLHPTAAGRAIAWNHDGEMIAVADYECVLTIWSKQGHLLQKVAKEKSTSYVAVDWHPCKNELIALTNDARVYDVSGNLIHQFQHRPEATLQLCVEWHQSGAFFVIGDYGDYDLKVPPLLQFWNADYQLIQSSDIAQTEYRNLSWYADGQFLATANRFLRIWSKEGEMLHETKSAANLWGVDWSPDGKYIVTSDEQHRVKVWNNKAELVKVLAL